MAGKTESSSQGVDPVSDWKDIFLQEVPHLIVPDFEAGGLFTDASVLTQYRQLHHLCSESDASLAVRPRSTEDVQALIRLAIRENIGLAARGGGSGVVQSLTVDQGTVVVDMRGMNQVGRLNATDGTVAVQAGVNALALENLLAAEGWTLGHWPQSIALATLGGLVATKSIGQYSTRYGGMENMVRGLEAVTGTGEILSLNPPGPRRSAGPELLPLFIGSEGTLGIITRLTLRVWPKPAEEIGLAFSTSNFFTGLDVIRRWMQAGLTPAVVRLYDPAESSRSFALSDSRAVLLTVFQGSSQTSAAQARDAIDLGGSEIHPESSELVNHWLDTRNDVGAWVPLLAQGFVVDTIDIAGPWSILHDLYQAVVAKTSAIPGVLGITGHCSHAYSDGANLYFTFMARPGTVAEGPALHHQIWSSVLEETLRLGGTVAHHHGVGQLRKEWMGRERGAELSWLSPIHALFDPYRILNRGVLWP